MRPRVLRLVLISYILFLSMTPVVAQEATVNQSGSNPSQMNSLTPDVHVSVPPLIKFNGVLPELQGQSGAGIINATFALYSDQSGGTQLWSERQNINIDSQGHFTVLLGNSSPEGLPINIFTSGEALWLGISLENGPERLRTMFASVPYALQAASAQTLAGQTADQFVTKDQLGTLLSTAFAPTIKIHPVGPAPVRCGFSATVPCPIFPPPASMAPAFEATSPVGPSFISDATTGSPFLIKSNSMVANLNADLLHGLDDSAFAKLNSANLFSESQELAGGSVYPPLQTSGSTPSPSSTQDFQATGISNGSLITQMFRWQATGTAQNGAQPQLGLLYAANGQTPTPTGLSINADGSINFASTQSFPGQAIITAIQSLSPPPGWGSGGNGGGSGSGNVSDTPPGNQTVTQPPGTSLNVNNLNNVRTVQASDNWLVTNTPTNLTAGVQATITLTPCPRGVDTNGNALLGGPNGGYQIRIVDVVPHSTNSETVDVTGGTCTSTASTGTIIFTPFFSHTASLYTIGSASAGIQEAVNDACGTSLTPWQNGNCQIVVPPTGPLSTGASGYDIYGTVYFHANGSVLSGSGTILNCHERGPCLQIGDLLNSNDNGNDIVQGISFRSIDDRSSDPAFSGSLIVSTQRAGGVTTIQTAKPHNFRTGDRVTQMLTDTVNYWGDVPSITVIDATHYSYSRPNSPDLPLQQTPGVVALSYEAVLDNGNGTNWNNIEYASTAEHGAFNHFFDFWDNEKAQINSFSNNSIPLNRSLNWTGSFIWSGGNLGLPNVRTQLASVITVNNANITAVGSNCATIYNSNGFNFQNSTCQANGPWQFLVSNVTGNYGGAAFQNIYSEGGMNPTTPAMSPWPGLGVAGFIGGLTSAVAQYTLTGQGTFAGGLPTVGSGSTTYVYYAIARDLTSGGQTSPIPFMLEKENHTSQVLVQWPRLALEGDTIVYDIIRNPAPQGTMYAAVGGYVAPYAGGCNGGSTSACGSVAVGVAQCSGFVCSFTDNTANPTSPYRILSGYFTPEPTFWPGAAVVTTTPLVSDYEVPIIGIAMNGTPAETAQYCSFWGSSGDTVCMTSPTSGNNGVPNQPPMILDDGPAAGGGGIPGAKGRLLFEMAPGAEMNYHQVITLFDSNPGKTMSTTGHRPVGDPADVYVGVDADQSMMIGGGQYAINQYVNSIGGGLNWGERLTSSLKTFNVPVQAPMVNVSGGIQVNGSYGQPGQCLMSNGTSSYWGTPGASGNSSATSSEIAFHTSDPEKIPSNVLPILMSSKVENQTNPLSALSQAATEKQIRMLCTKRSDSELLCQVIP